MKHRCNFLPIALRDSAYLDIHILMMQYTRACYLPSGNINTLNRKILLMQISTMLHLSFAHDARLGLILRSNLIFISFWRCFVFLSRYKRLKIDQNTPSNKQIYTCKLN